MTGDLEYIMIVYIDIDETICNSPNKPDYTVCYPIRANIAKANKMYEDGHTVVYWTARGSKTGMDWKAVTEKQLQEWGVKHHELKFGKPYYDLFIDDRNMNTRDWMDQ